MKIKFLAVYILAGVAFAGVSLWVFLSKGRSAKAVAAKYKLGGIMLTALSFLSAASCGNTPTVTCYEPATPPEVMCYDVAVQTDVPSIIVKGSQYMNVKAGEVLTITIASPTFEEYKCCINAAEGDNPALIQTKTFKSDEQLQKPEAVFELVLEPDGYSGEAAVTVYGIRSDAGGNPVETLLGADLPTITILG